MVLSDNSYRSDLLITGAVPKALEAHTQVVHPDQPWLDSIHQLLGNERSL